MALPEFYPEELIRIINNRNTRYPNIPHAKYEETFTHLSHIADFLNRYVIAIDRNFYDISPRRIAWHILESPKFEAFSYSGMEANSNTSFDFIGINAGTITILFDLFTNLLSSPTSFVGYGNFTNEDESRPSLVLTDIVVSELPFIIPRCEIRTEYAKNLTLIAVLFLIIHETTHLRNGHTDYKREHWADLDLEQATSPEDRLRRASKLQALEVDADQGALTLIIEMFFGFMETRSQWINTLAEADRAAQELAFGSPLRVIRTILYAAYAMFRSMEPIFEDRDSFLTSSHPRYMLRARFMVLKMFEIIQESPYAMNADSLIDSLYAFINEAERNIASAVGRTPYFNDFALALHSPAAQEQLDAVTTAYREIRESLVPHIRGGHLPQ